MSSGWVIDIYQPAAERFAAARCPVVQLIFYGIDRSSSVASYIRHLRTCEPMHDAVVDGVIEGKSAYAAGQYREDATVPRPVAELGHMSETVCLVIDSHESGADAPTVTHVFFAPKSDHATIQLMERFLAHQRAGCEWLKDVRPEQPNEQHRVRWYDGLGEPGER